MGSILARCLVGRFGKESRIRSKGKEERTAIEGKAPLVVTPASFRPASPWSECMLR